MKMLVLMLRHLYRLLLGCVLSVGLVGAAYSDTVPLNPKVSPEDAFIRNALVKQGEDKGLDKSPQFRLLMSQFRKEQLAKMALEHAANAGMPDFSARAEEIYNARLERDYHQPLRLRVRVLEMSIPEGQEAAIRQQLVSIRDQVQSGQLDFKAAVLTHSSDPEKRLTEGDSQWFAKGQKPDAIYEAALHLNAAHALSDVVIHRQAAYLLQFLDRKEPQTIPFEQVKDEIVSELAKSYREDNQQVVLDKLKTQFKETQTATSDTVLPKVNGM